MAKMLAVLLLTLKLVNSLPQNDFFANTRYSTCPFIQAGNDNDCSCHNLSGYEIQCPQNDPKIIVRYQPGEYAYIECTTSNESDFQYIPKIELGNMTTVQIRRCPLPRRKSIKSIFEQIGVTRVRRLMFQGSGVDIGNSLLKQHFEGLDDLQRLVLSRNGIAEFPHDLLDNMKNLEWLDLRSNKVHLPHKVFDKLENLKILELGYNNIENLEEGIFKNLGKLEHLNLWGNKLRNLTRESFRGAESVTDLDLSLNEIDSFEPLIFSLLTNLTTISLGSNNLIELPEGLFSENKKLKTVKILDNRATLEELPKGIFSELPDLLEVSLKSGLKSIAEDAFKGSLNLKTLVLSGNKIPFLPPTLFQDQPHLTDLDLSMNELQRLDNDLLSNTHELVVLRLSYNHLYNISASIFRNLKNLKELYLDNNDLHYMETSVFSGSSLLQIINLENNRLSFNEYTMGLPLEDKYSISPFQTLNDLRKLNLRNNTVTAIWSDWKNSNLRLEDLDLSYNEITMISSENLQFLSSKIFVNLSHNSISEINFQWLEQMVEANSASPRTSPIVVDLSNNPLKCDCLTWTYYNYLMKNMSEKVWNYIKIDADLKCVEPERLANKTVKQLDKKDFTCPLDSNATAIKKCPTQCICDVRPADYGLVINCSNQELTQIPILPRPTQIGLHFIELIVENNSLIELPSKNIEGYSEVTKLYARNNSIATLDASNLPENLTIFDLSENALKTVNESVIMFLNQSRTFEKIFLGDNPLSCSCETKDFVVFLQTNYRKVNDTVKCENGDKIQRIVVGYLCSSDNTLITVLCVTIAILGFFIGLISILYFKYHLEIKVWLFSHNLFLWFITEEELDKDKIYDAFISYSHKDQEFVENLLVPKLEKEPMCFKTCLHARDWVPGDMIVDQISKSVDDSRRTIVVLSKHFLESNWGRMEFRAAYFNSMKEKRARVIVVLHGDIGEIDDLDQELKAYLKTNTYVKSDDQWFWEKLRYAMPHPATVKGLSKRLMKNSLKSSVDDKLELIKPIPVTPPPLTTPPAEMNKPPFTISNGKHTMNGYSNGHVNGAFIINTNAKQSDV